MTDKAVTIWLAVPASLSTRTLSTFWRYLSKEERKRAGEFSFKRDQKSFTVAHGLLRYWFSKHLDIPPREVNIEYSGSGKPFIPGSGIEFSMSHIPDTAICIFSNFAPCGIDVTHPPGQETIPFEALAKKEQTFIRSHPKEDQAGLFADHWCLKEAYLKAIGIGLQVPPQEICVSFTDQEPCICHKAAPCIREQDVHLALVRKGKRRIGIAHMGEFSLEIANFKGIEQGLSV